MGPSLAGGRGSLPYGGFFAEGSYAVELTMFTAIVIFVCFHGMEEYAEE